MTMYKLSLNLSDLVLDFTISPDEEFQLNRKVMSAILVTFTERWEDLVNKELNHGREMYLQAMACRMLKANEISIGLLEGKDMAYAIEYGKAPYDMKPFFMNSRFRKNSKAGGWYIDIPFRHATQKAYANSRLFASVMPRGIYDAARNSDTPLRRIDLVKKYSTPTARRSAYTNSLYTSRAPIYQGLVKLDVVNPNGSTGSGYFTFRRVSDKSEPMSWENPGIKAHNFINRVADTMDIDKISGNAIEDFFKKL